MAKAQKREWVWLQCTECDKVQELNYRTQINVQKGIPEGLKDGLMKYCARQRKHTKHKIKRK